MEGFDVASDVIIGVVSEGNAIGCEQEGHRDKPWGYCVAVTIAQVTEA